MRPSPWQHLEHLQRVLRGVRPPTVLVPNRGLWLAADVSLPTLFHTLLCHAAMSWRGAVIAATRSGVGIASPAPCSCLMQSFPACRP